MRAETDSSSLTQPRRRYPRRASSRPVTDLGAIAHGEPRVEELLELLDEASDPQRRIYILQEIARVYRDDLIDPAAAAVALRAALQEDCTSSAVIDALEQLADEADCWSELLSELMEDAATLGHEDPRRAADLWVQISRWYDDPVAHREYATHAVRQALELVPHHTAALATLASLLREDGYWVELVGVLERQVAVTEEIAERVELRLLIADIADTHLGDHATAIRACRQALDLDGACREAFDTLRALLRRTDAAEEVAELLSQRSALIDDPDEHVELAVEIARIYGEQLGDRDRAERAWEAIDDRGGAIARLSALIDSGGDPREIAELHYRTGWFRLRGEGDESRAEWHLSQALAEYAGHVPSLRLLADLYRQRGDWRKASMMLGRAVHAADPADRDQLMVDNARILADELDDLDGATAACERIRATGEAGPATNRMLASLYARAGRWAELQPLLAELENEIASGGRQPEQLRALYHLMARSAAELGDQDKALAYFYEARTLAPGNVDVIRGLADQYFARSDWRKATTEYRALLTAGPRPADEAAVRYRLAVALRSLGDRENALQELGRVTELEPDHLPAADAAAELLVELGRWRAAVGAKSALLDLAPPDEQYRLHIELGDLYRDHLHEPRRALAMYRQAADDRADDHVALQRTLDVATALGDWPLALDTIERFAASEAVAVRRGSYLHAAAVIFRDELRDDDRAAELLERALDAFFADDAPVGGDELTRRMKSFAALDALHTRRRAWTEQARSYRRMLKRLPPGHPVLVELWHALGEVYRSRLKKYDEAAAAFEVARSLDPDNLERRAILAELYQLTSDSPANAADEHHEMLARDPGRVESYRALVEIYGRANRADQVWAACRALVFLDRATPAERDLYQRYRGEGLIKCKAPLTPDLRGRLTHPDEAGTVRLALALIRGAVASARPSALRLRNDQLVEPKRDPRPRIRLLAYAAAVLDRPLPEVYDQTRKKGALGFGLCALRGDLRPVLVPRAGFLLGDDRSAAFAVGRALSLLEPDRVLAAMFGDSELRSILAWIAGAPDDGEMRRLLAGDVAANLRPEQREQLAGARKALAGIDWSQDLERWLRAAVLTSDRTGFVLSGDLAESARMIAGAHVNPAGLTPASRIMELLRFSVTDDHASIRRHLCGRL